MKKFLVACVTAAACCNVPARAADMAVKAPPAPPVPAAVVSNWTGFYVGGFAGETWVNGSYTPTPPGGPAFAAISTRASGFLGGGYLGYDYELANKFVLGVRATVPFASVNQTSAIPPPAAQISGVTLNYKAQRAVGVNGLIGYDMGRWLPYVGTGAIWVTDQATLTVPKFGSASNTQQHTAWNVLAGVKYALTRNWAVGVQYNYAAFNTKTYYLTSPLLIQAGNANFSQDGLVGTLEYRF